MPKSIPFAISFHFSRFHFSCVPMVRLHRHRSSNEINVHVLIRHTSKLLSMMILQIFPLVERAPTLFFAHISYE